MTVPLLGMLAARLSQWSSGFNPSPFVWDLWSTKRNLAGFSPSTSIVSRQYYSVVAHIEGGA